MAVVQALRKGNMFEEDAQLWRVLDHQHIKVARGGATIRLKLRNVRTGSTVEKTYNNNTRMQDVRLESDEVEYLYFDGDLYHFMNTETFDQVALTPTVVEDVLPYMVDNQTVTLESYEGEALNVTLPTTVDLNVKWAEAAITGDTANVPNKQIELETGYKMQAPMFVKEGDIIRVDTRTGTYVTRVQQ